MIPCIKYVRQILLLHVTNGASHLAGKNLGVADDEIEWSSELMRHAGQEQRLVSTCDLELERFLFQLAKRSGQRFRTFGDALFEAGVKILQLPRHLVKVVGQYFELVASLDF